MPRLSVITAFLNEEDNLPVLRKRLTALAASLAPDFSCQFVLVDDHSSDKSAAIATAWREADPRVCYVRLSRNSGSHTAFLAGLAQASGDCAVLLAADLQDPPELVPELLDKWREGNDVVWAVRAGREQIPWSTRLTASIYYGLMRRYALPNMPPGGADFFLLDQRVVQALLSIPERNTSILGLTHYIGVRQAHVEYVKKARLSGVSKWTLSKKIKLFIDSLLSFSTLPLRVLHGLAISMGLTVVAMLVILGVYAAAGGLIAGWAWVVLAVLAVGAAQMFALAVAGSYLWRVFDQTRARPAYFLEAHLPDCQHLADTPGKKAG
ncbi:MAG: glycosyltransferase family 2 protein [Planctomycetes bacterium]|nr:glycosyltransferase family 2 protein [Planctomycetota bacterium]